jgi:hypothetical protein
MEPQKLETQNTYINLRMQWQKLQTAKIAVIRYAYTYT